MYQMKLTKQNLKAHPLRALWLWLTGYSVVMQWRGKESVRLVKTFPEAMQWVGCYPNDAVILIGKRRKLVASRHAAYYRK